MEVRWVIIARGCSLSRHGTLDIKEIFYQTTTNGPPYRVSFVVVAKVEVSPLEAGQHKTLTTQIKHERHGEIGSRDTELTLPGLKAWAKGPLYAVFKFEDVQFPTEGEYSINLIVDGETKGAEWLLIQPS